MSFLYKSITNLQYLLYIFANSYVTKKSIFLKNLKRNGTIIIICALKQV